MKKIKIAQWREGLPEGYDVSDDAENGFEEMDYAIKNAKEYKIEIPNELGIFQIMTAEEAMNTTPQPTEMLIDTILPKDFNTILAGTTGCNKSYFAMQMGMSLANDQEHFLGWKIREKGLKVLYVDTEAGMTECHRRFKRIAHNINFQNNERFMLISKEGIHADIWTDLQAMININKSNIVIIDCLYNSSIERNLHKGPSVAKVTDQLTLLKSKFSAHVFAVHHFNKYEHEKGLIRDRMSGAGALQNWVEHLILMTETNETDLRLMRIDKSRGIYYSSQYYGIDWDADKQWLSMRGIVSNVNELLVDKYKKKKWIEALDRMPEKFETKDWLNVIECEWKYSESTAKKWLVQLMHCEMIEKAAHGIYSKKLKLIDDEINQ